MWACVCSCESQCRECVFRHCLSLSVACILCYWCVFSTIVILIIMVYPLCVYKVIEQYLLSFSVLGLSNKHTCIYGDMLVTPPCSHL